MIFLTCVETISKEVLKFAESNTEVCEGCLVIEDRLVIVVAVVVSQVNVPSFPTFYYERVRKSEILERPFA